MDVCFAVTGILSSFRACVEVFVGVLSYCGTYFVQSRGVPVVTGDMFRGVGLCSLRCAFPWPLAAGPLQSPMRQLLRSRLLCILTLCEQVPNGHYTKTAASL